MTIVLFFYSNLTMYLFELIEQSQELEDLYGPMTKIFIRNDDDDLIESYHLIASKDEKEELIVVVE